jgi:hypothetical protein
VSRPKRSGRPIQRDGACNSTHYRRWQRNPQVLKVKVTMKVDKEKFEALVGKLLEQKPSKRETLKTGEKKKAATIIPPKQ